MNEQETTKIGNKLHREQEITIRGKGLNEQRITTIGNILKCKILLKIGKTLKGNQGRRVSGVQGSRVV